MNSELRPYFFLQRRHRAQWRAGYASRKFEPRGRADPPRTWEQVVAKEGLHEPASFVAPKWF